MAPDLPKSAAQLFGAAPRDTRERILFTALDLFYTHGFHEVGLDRILTAVGVTKTTFYNHFESRDHLILEALAVRDGWEARSGASEGPRRGRLTSSPAALDPKSDDRRLRAA